MNKNLFEELEKNRKPYTPDKFDIAIEDYRNKFNESYPLPYLAGYDSEEVIKDIYKRIESGEKKPVKEYIRKDGIVY